ncbi:TetR/AcrR family transcriptional regulator [Saccharomonospora azurea]
MPRPRVPDRRGRILSAARDLMLEKGWPATTVADIAAHAGIGKGAVYLEFPDKAAILAAVLNRSMRQLTADVHRRVREARELVDLSAVYRFGVEALLDEPVMRALYLGDTAVLGEHVGQVVDRRYVERAGWLTDYVRRLQDAGVLDPAVPGDVIVRVLSVFTLGLVHAPGVLGASDPEELTEAVRLFADLVGRGLATESRPDAEEARAAQVELLDRLDHQLALLGDP